MLGLVPGICHELRKEKWIGLGDGDSVIRLREGGVWRVSQDNSSSSNSEQVWSVQGRSTFGVDLIPSEDITFSVPSGAPPTHLPSPSQSPEMSMLPRLSC